MESDRLQPLRVLIVDDDEVFRCLCAGLLTRDAGRFEVHEARSAGEAIHQLRDHDFDCLLIDQGLPDADGTDLMSVLRGQRPDLYQGMVLITGEGSEEVVAQAMRAGAQDYLPKHQVSRESLRRVLFNARDKARLELSLRERNAALEDANRVLRQRNEEIAHFYHRISHEIKTPLTSAGLFLSVLAEGHAGPLTEQQREIVGHAIASCQQLAGHFNDLVDCTRLETRKLIVRTERQSLQPLLARGLAAVRGACRDKDIALQADIDDALPQLDVDGGRIVQVVANLLGNAVKFTPSGGSVRLRARFDREAAQVHIVVEDSGIGIAPEDQSRIFERLYQVTDGHDSDAQGAGLGLGLTIAAELVALHGGRIDVDSEAGRGSRFTVTLPCETADRAGNRSTA